MALDEMGSANGLSTLLCANCGGPTLHRRNVCVNCRTIVTFPSEQTKIRLSKNARRALMALDERPRAGRRK